MPKIGLFEACFVSFPEVVVIMVTSFLLVGRKDLLDIRNKTNLLKILISGVLMTVAVALVKNFIGQGTAIISLAIYVLIWIAVFRIHWLEATVGVLITGIAFMTLEYVCILIGSQLFGLHFDGSPIDSKVWLYISVTSRLLQIILAVVIYKIPFTVINLGPIKGLPKNRMRKIALICLSEALYIVVILKVARFDYDTTTLSGIIDMATSIILILGFAVFNIVMTVKLMDNIREAKRTRGIALMWVDTLLKDPRNDIIEIRKKVREALEEAVRDFKRE